MAGINKFNPLAAKTVRLSLVENLRNQVGSEKAGAIQLAKGEAAIDALRSGDGLAGISLAFSLGQGRGGSRFDVNGAELSSVIDSLNDFNEDEDVSQTSTAEAIRRTLTVETQKDGPDLVSFQLSLAKSSRAVKIPVDEFQSFLACMRDLESFNPNEDLSLIPASEAIARTIAVETHKDGDGAEEVVSFKLSLGKHSRATRVPLNEWSEFKGFLGNLEGWTADSVPHYRAQVLKVEEAAAEKAAKEAEQALKDAATIAQLEEEANAPAVEVVIPE